MPVSSPRVPIAAIRDAAALAVEREGLRAVARQVGMSPNGLKQFLAGRRPYNSTQLKLNAWYAAHGRDHGGGSRLDSARAAVALLLEDFPAKRRAVMAERIYDLLAAGHREDRREPPEWLDAAREPA